MFYPIFHPLSTGERLALCAEAPTNCHTFRVRRGAGRSLSVINLRLEPRRLSHPAVPHPSSYRPDGGCSGCTRGGVEGYIPGWCIGAYMPGWVYQGGYPLPYIPQGGYPSPVHTSGCTMPTMLPRCVLCPPCYPGVYYASLIPQGVLRLPHTSGVLCPPWCPCVLCCPCVTSVFGRMEPVVHPVDGRMEHVVHPLMGECAPL